MIKRYARRAERDIAAEITAFLADPSVGGDEITGMINLLGKVGEVAIFGGMPRDIARGGPAAFDSDVDLVVDGRSEDLDLTLAGLGAMRNKYGGYRLKIARHYFDVWTLSSTWAVREHRATVKCLADLVYTTFFDCDAVVYLCADRSIHVGEGFARWLHHGIVEINLVENPNPPGMAARTRRIVHEWKEDIGPRLAAYVSAVSEGLLPGLSEATVRSALTSCSEKVEPTIKNDRRSSRVMRLHPLPYLAPLGEGESNDAPTYAGRGLPPRAGG